MLPVKLSLSDLWTGKHKGCSTAGTRSLTKEAISMQISRSLACLGETEARRTKKSLCIIADKISARHSVGCLIPGPTWFGGSLVHQVGESGTQYACLQSSLRSSADSPSAPDEDIWKGPPYDCTKSSLRQAGARAMRERCDARTGDMWRTGTCARTTLD